MKIVALSDCHGRHDRLLVPDGDVLVVAGDFTEMGEKHQVESFGIWLRALPHRHKVVVAGNHDFLFERNSKVGKQLLVHGDPGVHYLRDRETVIDGIRFWGSPWTPFFHNWAFNVSRGPDISAKWALIPDDTDVLVVHGPPAGILDTTFSGSHVGCQDLLDRISVVQPRLVIFGHIHEAFGEEVRVWKSGKTTTFLNVATDYAQNPATEFSI